MFVNLRQIIEIMILIEKLTQKQVNDLAIKSWPIWEKEVSEFPWQYDMEEKCYIIEGEVSVFVDGKEYRLKKGDFITFPKGLKCHWVIKKDIRKYYQFV